MRSVVVSGDGLTLADVVDVARGEARAELAATVPAAMEPSRAVVTAAIAGDAPVYGVNTGFGALADTRVGEKDLVRLQAAIIRSHAAGTGEPLGDEVVRALLLLRARTLAAGYSGVRPVLPQRLLEARPGPAPGRTRQGLGGGVRGPGAACPPGPAADRGGTAARPR